MSAYFPRTDLDCIDSSVLLDFCKVKTHEQYMKIGMKLLSFVEQQFGKQIVIPIDVRPLSDTWGTESHSTHAQLLRHGRSVFKVVRLDEKHIGLAINLVAEGLIHILIHESMEIADDILSRNVVPILRLGTVCPSVLFKTPAIAIEMATASESLFHLQSTNAQDYWCVFLDIATVLENLWMLHRFVHGDLIITNVTVHHLFKTYRQRVCNSSGKSFTLFRQRIGARLIDFGHASVDLTTFYHKEKSQLQRRRFHASLLHRFEHDGHTLEENIFDIPMLFMSIYVDRDHHTLPPDIVRFIENNIVTPCGATKRQWKDRTNRIHLYRRIYDNKSVLHDGHCTPRWLKDQAIEHLVSL